METCNDLIRDMTLMLFKIFFFFTFTFINLATYNWGIAYNTQFIINRQINTGSVCNTTFKTLFRLLQARRIKEKRKQMVYIYIYIYILWMGEGRSFHQPGTVSENVLESDIVPLCDGITRHRSLVVPRLLEKCECKQVGGEAVAVLYTSISVLNLMWAANGSHGPFWAHWKPVVLLHSESWSSKTTLRFLTELDEWGSIIQGHDCFPTIAMRM